MIMYMKNLNEKLINDLDIITEDVDIIPCNTGVLIKFYDKNPYRAVEKTQSGLIVGMESTKMYKSNETGEMEFNDEVVSCAKVIAVGSKCQNVEVGDDVYVIRHIANPLPFRKMQYYVINEQNIMVRIVKKK
jgi:co-chaperonin GroES (HSP10)